VKTVGERLSRTAPLFVLSLLFLLFLSNPLWDPDFFWHLRTGQYIATHGEIPQEDSFSYTTAHGETLRKKVILGQYWLSQVIFFFVWKHAQAGGIIMLRAMLLLSTLLTMYFLIRKKVDPLLASVFLFISGNVFVYFTGERPQLFSFLGTALLIFLIERFRELKGRTLYALPPLMLVWANLHGGVILGDVLLFIYVASEGVKFLSGRDPMQKRDYLRLILWGGAAIVASLVNPNTYHLFAAFYQFSDSLSHKMSTEFLSPLTMAFKYKKIFWGHLVILLMTPFLLAARGKKMDISHLAVISFLYAISLVSARFMIFLGIAFPLLAVYAGDLIRDRFQRIRVWVGVGLIVFLCSALWGKGMPSFRIHESYPGEAVAFVREARPKGNIFNYFDWGGYLMAALPEYPVFIDGRGLDEGVQLKYNLILNGSTMKHADKYEWETLLDNYGVNIVLLPLYDFTTGERIRLADILLHSPGWRISYSDAKSVVFLRIR
jgi:hypothetical protein